MKLAEKILESKIEEEVIHPDLVKQMKIMHRFLGELLGEAKKGTMSIPELKRNVEAWPAKVSGIIKKEYK